MENGKYQPELYNLGQPGLENTRGNFMNRTARAVATICAGAVLLVGGASAAFATDEVDRSNKVCRSTEDVVTKGDSTAGYQSHWQYYNNMTRTDSYQFPYKSYRHADYMNRGHSTLNRYIMQVAAGSSYFYDSTTYAYCVN